MCVAAVLKRRFRDPKDWGNDVRHSDYCERRAFGPMQRGHGRGNAGTCRCQWQSRRHVISLYVISGLYQSSPLSYHGGEVLQILQNRNVTGIVIDSLSKAQSTITLYRLVSATLKTSRPTRSPCTPNLSQLPGLIRHRWKMERH